MKKGPKNLGMGKPERKRVFTFDVFPNQEQLRLITLEALIFRGVLAKLTIFTVSFMRGQRI